MGSNWNIYISTVSFVFCMCNNIETLQEDHIYVSCEFNNEKHNEQVKFKRKRWDKTSLLITRCRIFGPYP